MEQAVDLSDCPGGLDSSPGNPVVARKETNVAEDRRVFVHLVRHGEASHNKAVRNRLPGLSRSSIFKSAEHFDSRLSPVGRAQCIDAAERMPRSLCDALRSFYLCESRKLREEENGGDFQTRRIGHYKGGDDSRVEQSLCPGKSDEESEGIYGQNLSTFHKESQSVLSHSAHTQTSQKRVILLASTLRRSLETAHLVLSHAVQLIEHGDMNANVSEREDDADESIPTAAARSDSFRPPLSPEVRTDVRNRFERSLPESPRDPNNELSTGYPGRPSSAISDGADGEAECVTERSLLEVHNHSDRRLSESPISEDNDCQVVGKEKDRCEGAAGISSTEAGTIETVEEAERGVLDIPVHSLESMREWSGGGHVCDGRVSVDDLRDFCRPRFRSVSFEVDSNEDPLPPSMPRESRQDVERRCLSFLRTLFRVASRESPVLGVTTTPEGRAGHREEEKKAWDITAERRSTLPVEELTGSEVARPSLSSTTASHDVHVVCVVHSAWTRHLFALLGLFDPSRRGLKNCEWRSFTTSLRGIHAAINTVRDGRYISLLGGFQNKCIWCSCGWGGLLVVESRRPSHWSPTRSSSNAQLRLGPSCARVSKASPQECLLCGTVAFAPQHFKGPTTSQQREQGECVTLECRYSSYALS
ncbi:phosphoglycerate mutase family protein [Cystoisospora suis]|uniref:Phosphoglycerate mutase family protein n=1 Tax=Cystoisospora suis TaxID=483139 RepID=A0A2C6KLE1_9APIC|nr:phosphoglycerate mutase family protein [Cystoisospora suis]